MSPPTRGRGLKPCADLEQSEGRPLRGAHGVSGDRLAEIRLVAPYAGARIETTRPSGPTHYAGARIETVGCGRRRWLAPSLHSLASAERVAPYAGARIETLWMRPATTPNIRVAPYAGARIETWADLPAAWRHHRSPPTRGRGLKPFRPARVHRCRGSPPTRGRGLKRSDRYSKNPIPRVAPYAGARIETHVPALTLQAAFGSPPTRGRGLKHP